MSADTSRPAPPPDTLMTDTVDPPSAPPMKNMLEVLHAYERRMATVALTMHASWLPRLFDAEMQAAWHLDQAGTHRPAHLHKAMKLKPVPVSAFASVANRLALLDPASLIKVLAARELFARRATLRRCIDRTVMQPLLAMVGPAAMHILLSQVDTPNDSAGSDPALPLTVMTDTDWALAGYARFKHDDVWSDRSLRKLMRITLPALELVELPAKKSDASSAESATFLRLLPTLFPEWTWLFG